MTSLTVLALLACGEAPLDYEADEFTNPSEADSGYDELGRTKDEPNSYNGMFNYCDGVATCDAGEGDCDSDDQCTGALVCGTNNGNSVGLWWSIDVCVEDHCSNGVQDADETSIDIGGADCGTCGGSPGDNEGFCTAGCPCHDGQGDCDDDTECVAGTSCTNNVGPTYGFASWVDVCLADLDEAFLVAGDLIITEVMNNPDAVGDGEGEYFEVYNNSTRTVDLEDMVFRDDGTNSFTVSSPLVVTPKQYIVFAVNADPLVNGGFDADYDFPNGFALANGDDELIIETSTGTEIDRVEWDGGPNWPDLTGASMELGGPPPPSGDNNDGANWCASRIAAPLYITGTDKGSPGHSNWACP